MDQPEETTEHGENVTEEELYNKIFHEEEIIQDKQTPPIGAEEEFKSILMTIIRMDPTTRPTLLRLIQKQDMCTCIRYCTKYTTTDQQNFYTT